MAIDKDIVPELLVQIQKDFEKNKNDSKIIKKLLEILSSGDATYLNANDYAVEIGEILSKVLNLHITPNVLPDGRVYFNIANRILNTTLKNNFDLITDYATNVQEQLNKQAGIGLKPQSPTINQDRIDSLINKLTSVDNLVDVKWVLGEPIVNFSQSIIDDTIEANVDFHARAGLSPQIVRTVSGNACDWCKNLAGIYDYLSLKDNEIFKRHDRCRCTVDYYPGTGKKQDVWTKYNRKLKKIIK